MHRTVHIGLYFQQQKLNETTVSWSKAMTKRLDLNLSLGKDGILEGLCLPIDYIAS